MPLIPIAAPEGADPALAPWYRSLHVPGSQSSCCDLSDCRGAEMRLGHDQYEVYIDKKTFGESAPDAWVKVPEMAILYEHDNPTGRAVVCWYQNRIICLVKASET